MCHPMSEAVQVCFSSSCSKLQVTHSLWLLSVGLFSLRKSQAELRRLAFLSAQGPKAGGGCIPTLFPCPPPDHLETLLGRPVGLQEARSSYQLFGKRETPARFLGLWGDVWAPQPTTDTAPQLGLWHRIGQAGFQSSTSSGGASWGGGRGRVFALPQASAVGKGLWLSGYCWMTQHRHPPSYCPQLPALPSLLRQFQSLAPSLCKIQV